MRKWALGPLDKYGNDQLLTEQERQNYRAQALAALAGRKPVGEQILLPIVP